MHMCQICTGCNLCWGRPIHAHLGCDEVVGGSDCGAADLRGGAVIVRLAGARLGPCLGRLALTVPPVRPASAGGVIMAGLPPGISGRRV